MRLMVDTSGVTFTVGREVQARTEQQNPNAQRMDRNTGLPMWTVQLVAVDDGGAEVINVTVCATEAPKVTVGTVVTPLNLQAIPWAQNGKNGTAFRASDIRPMNTGSKASQQASS